MLFSAHGHHARGSRLARQTLADPTARLQMSSTGDDESSSSSSNCPTVRNRMWPPLHMHFACSDHLTNTNSCHHRCCTAKVYKTEVCARWRVSRSCWNRHAHRLYSSPVLCAQRGNCTYGDDCQFAHGVDELKPRARPPKYKTVPCEKRARSQSNAYCVTVWHAFACKSI